MTEKRAAYANFEKTVLYLYDQGLLTLGFLDYIAERYRLVSMDSAGSCYVRAQDGKDVRQVCIALVDPTFPLVTEGSSEDHEEYWEQEQKKWEEIVRKRWGWRTLRTEYQHASVNAGKILRMNV